VRCAVKVHRSLLYSGISEISAGSLSSLQCKSHPKGFDHVRQGNKACHHAFPLPARPCASAEARSDCWIVPNNQSSLIRRNSVLKNYEFSGIWCII
jgi:hypothetical protein